MPKLEKEVLLADVQNNARQCHIQILNNDQAYHQNVHNDDVLQLNILIVNKSAYM